jgi:hypothetical protein
LEDTREPSVAEAQVLAITELAARATTRDGPPRAILLAADDYSAVSRRVPLSNLYERGRSLGIGVQVSAQSWQGLGADDDERYRIAATADGGVWGDEGSTRLQHSWVADPDLIRRLRTGQACHISHGTATYVQVARPRPSPLTLLPPPPPPQPVPPAVLPATHPEAATQPLPVIADDFWPGTQ